MTQRGFLYSSGVTYLGTIGSVLCMAAFYGVSLRVGTEAFGALQSTLSALFLLSAGRSAAASYIVIHAAGDERRLAGVAKRGVFLAGLVGLGIAGVFTLLAPFLRDFLHLESSASFVLIGLAAIPGLFASTAEGILNVQKRFVALSASSLVVPLCNFLLALFLLRDGLSGMDAGMIVLGSQSISCVNFLLVDWASLRGGKPFTEHASSLAEIATLMAAILLLGASLRMDVLWARHLLPETEAGSYAIAAMIAIVLYLITSGVARVTTVSLREKTDTKVIAGSYLLIIGTAIVLATAFATIGQPALQLLAGRTIKVDWAVLLPLFIALTCYSTIMFDFSCLNVVTKRVHLGFAILLVIVQAAALTAFGKDMHAIAWTQCAVMAVMAVGFSLSLIRTIRAVPAVPARHPAEVHLAAHG